MTKASGTVQAPFYPYQVSELREEPAGNYFGSFSVCGTFRTSEGNLPAELKVTYFGAEERKEVYDILTRARVACAREVVDEHDRKIS